MKAIGLPPSDPRVRQMNDAQWLWCYFNEMQDEKEMADSWKSRFDYLTYFINFEMAKSVHEADSKKKRKGSKYQVDGLHSNSAFDKEIYAATLGYEPSCGLTVDEFLKQHKEKQSDSSNVDMMNDSFDDLLANGNFVEVADHSQGIGNQDEHIDDFLDRAFAYEQMLIAQREAAKNDLDIPIGIEEEDWNALNSKQTDVDSGDIQQDKTEEEIIKEAIELDLDIFDFDEDDY